MPEALVLETRLTRAECDERLQGGLDRRAFTFRIDPARPVRGRSSIGGFVVRHPREAIVDAIGTYLLASQGRTRIALRFQLAWRSQLWWMVLNLLVLAPIGGVLLAGTRPPMAADPFTVVLASAALIAIALVVIEVALVLAASLTYGRRQRAYLMRVITETLAAR